MTTAQLNRKINYLPSKVQTIVSRTLKSSEGEIVRRIQEQLSRGEDSDGKLKADGETTAYGGYRSKPYAKQRQRIGRQTQYVDLNFWGDWQGSMYVKVDGMGYSVGSKNTHQWKGEDVLVHHWGENIYALNDDNFDWLLDRITDSLYNELKTYFS